jgi:DNA-binding protein HU-beta
MKKADLIHKISKEAKITRAQAEDVLVSILKTTTSALSKGDKVTLSGFGTFSVSKKAARIGRNPRTGKEMKIKAKKVAKFSSGITLKRKIDDPETDDTGPMRTKR